MTRLPLTGRLTLRPTALLVGHLGTLFVSRVVAEFQRRGASAPSTLPVAPYLATEQLAALTPWTVQAINTMRKRGVFKRGVHYFQPTGGHGQVIFKWAAVVDLIEGAALGGPELVDISRAIASVTHTKVLDVEEALKRAARLLA